MSHSRTENLMEGFSSAKVLRLLNAVAPGNFRFPKENEFEDEHSVIRFVAEDPADKTIHYIDGPEITHSLYHQFLKANLDKGCFRLSYNYVIKYFTTFSYSILEVAELGSFLQLLAIENAKKNFRTSDLIDLQNYLKFLATHFQEFRKNFPKIFPKELDALVYEYMGDDIPRLKSG